MLNWHGFISWVEYLIAFMGEVWKHLFSDLGVAGLVFSQTAATGYTGATPSKYQWIVEGNIPSLSNKGEDIIAAVMTIVHNGLVAVAQFTTLLPYQPIQP